MPESPLQFWLRQFYRFVSNHQASEPNRNNINRSAVVLAPHPDDETLGCGGMITKKKRAEADVKIVFMTDGSYSHLPELISGNELKSIRVNEAIAATHILGVKKNDLVFLDFEDGKLDKSLESAIDRVFEILRMKQPEEIFIPYHQEPLPDHVATHRIGISALQKYQSEVIIYEYPIWFWQLLLQKSLPMNNLRNIFSVIKRRLIFLRDFRCSVYIGDVLKIKRAALEQHKSQMTQLVVDSRWPTLDRVSNGEFLGCFFQEYELFYRYSLPDQSDKSKMVRL